MTDERTRFIEHEGERILLFDYSGIADPEAGVREIEASKSIVARQPEGSLLTLVDVSGSRYNTRVVQALKDLAAHNKPYVFAGAVVGLGALHRIVYQTVIRFSGRQIPAFDNREEAKAWLVTQKRKNR